MENNGLIVHKLYSITTSTLVSIARLYQSPQVETSNVKRLQKALLEAKDRERVEVRVTVDVAHDDLIDMIDALDECVDAYKRKYNCKTIPKDLNIYGLIEALNKIDAKTFVRDLFRDSSQVQEKRKLKADLIAEEREKLKAKMKADMLRN